MRALKGKVTNQKTANCPQANQHHRNVFRNQRNIKKHTYCFSLLLLLLIQQFLVFTLRSSGECHAGSSSLHHYDRYGKGRCKDCIGTDFNDCNDRKFCAGKKIRNMVYKIVGKNG